MKTIKRPSLFDVLRATQQRTNIAQANVAVAPAQLGDADSQLAIAALVLDDAGVARATALAEKLSDETIANKKTAERAYLYGLALGNKADAITATIKGADTIIQSVPVAAARLRKILDKAADAVTEFRGVAETSEDGRDEEFAAIIAAFEQLEVAAKDL